MRKHRLHKVFEPESVALVGASIRPLSVGGQLLSRLIESDFKGALYPVNPAHDNVRGLQCYAGLGDIDGPVDLAVIAIPAPSIAQVMRDCGEHGVAAAIIISAGFAEVGASGQALQNEIVNIARAYNIALLGPNCLGVIRPSIGLNASFAKSRVAAGHVAMVAQSGAFCSALLDWGDSRGFGFSAVASLGATADVGFGEVLDYLALDMHTRSILLYIEGVSDARAFLSGLRSAARLKPVIVLKSGRSERGNRAAVSHTGAITGADAVFDAAIRRAGAVRVNSVNQLFSAAQTLASGVRVEGPRLAVLTNGGGPGVMAADRAADLQVPLADLSAASLETLSAALPHHWSHSNPVDILGDACHERYRLATEVLLADPGVDGVLVLLSPQGMTDPTACAEGVIAAIGHSRKPVITCWLGEKLVREGRQRFTTAGVPCFNSPEAGVEAFGHLAAYRRNQNALLQAPPPLAVEQAPDIAGARRLIDKALAAERYTLDDAETHALLRAFHIPSGAGVDPCAPGRDLQAGITRDPVFGPVVNFGACGAAAEDSAPHVALPPLNRYLAEDLLRGSGTDGAADRLVELLMRLSEIACELPEIQELEIRPLRLVQDAVAAMQTRVVVATRRTDHSRYGHMAIHPYPPDLETTWLLDDGTRATVRPIRPEDAGIEREFVDSLSSQSKYFRFMNHMDKISPLLLARFTQIDYDREMALVVVLDDRAANARMIAVARYIAYPDKLACEFALTVADAWQRHGIGRRLMERLIAMAAERGLESMEGDVLTQNTRMLRLCHDLGFATVRDSDDPEVVVVRRDL